MKGNFAAIALIVVGALAPGINLDLFEIDIALGVALFFPPAGGRPAAKKRLPDLRVEACRGACYHKDSNKKNL